MDALRFMSFNLRRDVERDGDHRWRHRRDRVARVVEEQAPHALATQEALPGMLEDLDARLPHLRRVGTCRRGDGSDEHVAIYYDPRRLLLVAWGDLWLSDTPELPGSATWGNRHPRLATWARLTDQETGRSFTFVSTHLDHESPRAREEAARFLAARFPDAVLAGDFNDLPGGEVHRRLTATRDDPHAHEAEGTYHAFTGVPRLGRIDWILLPDAFRATAARVLREGVPGAWPSDHFPVVAHVALAEALVAAPPS